MAAEVNPTSAGVTGSDDAAGQERRNVTARNDEQTGSFPHRVCDLQLLSVVTQLSPSGQRLYLECILLKRR